MKKTYFINSSLTKQTIKDTTFYLFKKDNKFTATILQTQNRDLKPEAIIFDFIGDYLWEGNTRIQLV